jgi:hypothetical protein
MSSLFYGKERYEGLAGCSYINICTTTAADRLLVLQKLLTGCVLKQFTLVDARAAFADMAVKTC